MLKLDPRSARGIHNLSQDVRTLIKSAPKPLPQSSSEIHYRVRFSFIDFLKIGIYSILTIAIIKSLILVLHW